MYVHDIQHVEIKILSEQHFYRYKTSLILPSKLKLTMIKGVKELRNANSNKISTNYLFKGEK